MNANGQINDPVTNMPGAWILSDQRMITDGWRRVSCKHLRTGLSLCNGDSSARLERERVTWSLGVAVGGFAGHSLW
jgi:hypothetical protein